MQRLHDMLPFSERSDRLNLGRANIEKFGKVPLEEFSTGIKLPNFSNLMLLELSEWMAFSFHRILSAFRDHVLNIVLVGAGEKVKRITARGIITMMANFQPFWNRTVSQLPSETMGHAPSPFVSTGAPNPISSVIDFSQKLPAFLFRFYGNFCPKSIRYRGQHDFSPPCKGSSFSGGKFRNILMRAFEFHDVGLCSKKGCV